MLLTIGTVIFVGNGGPSLEKFGRKTTGQLAEKGLIGGLPGHEWTGWAAELSLSGSVLPFHLGGLGDIDDLHSYAATGTKVPVIRGDGAFLGWYGVASVGEQHAALARNGVGYEVTWDVSLTRVGKPDATSIQAMQAVASNLTERVVLATSDALSAITSLFG
jgi:phage protein U